MVFQHLADDPVTSVCLGLACKGIHAVYKTFHPDKISLSSYIKFGPGEASMSFLRNLLQIWVGPKMQWDWKTDRFVSKPRKLLRGATVLDGNW
jgi:hypothetical protein